MREGRPLLNERLLATATFGGIALATAMAIDFLVTGGFEILPPPTPVQYVDPFAYAGISDARAAAPPTTTTAVAWNDPMLIDDGAPAAEQEEPPPEDLVGDARAQVGGGFVAPSEDELYREIAALYESQDEHARAAEARYANRAAADDGYVVEPAYEDAPAIDAETDDVKKPEPPASDSASPW